MPRDDRGKDIDVHLVELASSSVEYQEVIERLQKTVASDLLIKSVERIQNPYLYQAYQLRKQKMDRDNPEANNERQLFHGTNSNNVKKINTQGFDRSFTGSAHGEDFEVIFSQPRSGALFPSKGRGLSCLENKVALKCSSPVSNEAFILYFCTRLL